MPAPELTHSHVSATRKRAELRGREAVARWRIRAAVWAGRLFAVLFAASALPPLLTQTRGAWPTAIVLWLMAAGIALAAERMKNGSQAAAIGLLVLFVATRLASWLLLGQRWYAGALWVVIIAGALVNGVWGTFALAGVRREAKLVPPFKEGGLRAEG